MATETDETTFDADSDRPAHRVGNPRRPGGVPAAAGVVIAGILHALFLMGVSVATVHLSRTQTDPAVKGGRGYCC